MQLSHYDTSRMNVGIKTILRYYFLGILIGLVVLVVILVNAHEPHRLQIYFFDIGQGDSILIRTPDRHTILVDGGPNQKVVEKISSVLPWYDKTIDLMVLTHPHADHVNGLTAVLARYRVLRVVFTDVAYNSSVYQAWRDAVTVERSEVTIADHLGDIYVGGNVSINVLYPGQSLSGKIVSNLNNSSIVFNLSYGDFNALLMGDQEREEDFADLGLIRPVDVLKVGHHGSRNGSDPVFLSAVRPELAVISDGVHNRYGHPHYETLKNLELINARVLRTDIDGDVIIESDGERWWVTPH